MQVETAGVGIRLRFPRQSSRHNALLDKFEERSLIVRDRSTDKHSHTGQFGPMHVYDVQALVARFSSKDPESTPYWPFIATRRSTS